MIKRFTIPLAGRPVNADVILVSLVDALFKASFHSGWTEASGQDKKAVPSWTPFAPRISAAAIPLPSAIPPAAIIGTDVALTTCGNKENNPISPAL